MKGINWMTLNPETVRGIFQTWLNEQLNSDKTLVGAISFNPLSNLWSVELVEKALAGKGNK